MIMLLWGSTRIWLERIAFIYLLSLFELFWHLTQLIFLFFVTWSIFTFLLPWGNFIIFLKHFLRPNLHLLNTRSSLWLPSLVRCFKIILNYLTWSFIFIVSTIDVFFISVKVSYMMVLVPGLSLIKVFNRLVTDILHTVVGLIRGLFITVGKFVDLV